MIPNFSVKMTALVERSSRYAVGEWEDSVAFSESKRCFAVADGASASFMAREWAATLTSAFIDDPVDARDEHALEDWLAVVRESFHLDGDVDAPYYVRAAAQRGSHSTILCVRFVADQGAVRWKAWAVGDTVLLHVRGGRLVTAFPIDNPDEFGYSPDLVSSAGNRAIPDGLVRAYGSAEPGDILMGATDALAAWTLEHDERAIAVLSEMTAEAFPEFVRTARAAGLVDDDVTLLRCHVGSNGGQR